MERITQAWPLQIKLGLALIVAASAANAQTDFARVVAVSPGIAAEIRDHQAVQFTVKVHYVLASIEKAIMGVFVERYTVGPDGCDAAVRHHTEGGAWPIIKRGEGDVTVRFAWHETTGKLPVPFGDAFLGIGVNFWTDNNGRPGRRFAAFGANAFCRPVTP